MNLMRNFLGAVITAACLFGHGLHAATVRLDDTGSFALQPRPQMQWRTAVPQTGKAPVTEVRVQVQIRIDTRAWVGKPAQIYMVLPLDPGPQLEVEWQTQGRLLPGRLVSGQRTLVFTGPITTPTLEDQLVVLLINNGSWSDNLRRLDFHFELDTE